MHPTLTTSFMALQAERDTLDSRAYRGSLAADAATSTTRRPVTRRIRQHAGMLLVGVGQRLRGEPEPAPAELAMKTSH